MKNSFEWEIDTQMCRAKHIGPTGFAECLTDNAIGCKYSLPFGYSFLCKHPQREKYIKNTMKDKKKVIFLQK
ncbi:hypothetical protein H8E88_25330 [candidate division KSB1 bacterium]|nr:hypothetical protein [candidate division KSB1 bacterium]MBL7094594.1 hypothetical protein [candidate division KSB1 bacterium]